MSWAPDKSDIGESGKCLPLFAFRAPRPARLGALTMLTWGRRGSGFRKSRSAAARPRKSSRRTYKIVNCLCAWEPFWGPIWGWPRIPTTIGHLLLSYILRGKNTKIYNTRGVFPTFFTNMIK